MHFFFALLGGAIIGLAATLLLLSVGRVAGVSGFATALLPEASEARDLKLLFLAGLVAAGLGLRVAGALPSAMPSWPLAIVAGLLVGVGTRLGSGCTSGHGVCGIARLSRRSMVATCVFMGTGAITVAVMRLV